LCTVQFQDCPLQTPDQVTAAFEVLRAKMGALLARIGRSRAALLVNIASLQIGTDVTQVWGRTLKEFLEAHCLQYSPDHYVVARYNSQPGGEPLSPEALQAAVVRIQIMTEAAMEGFQSNILSSREEAIAVIQRLRARLHE
jgi:hypothetical protein